jgi:hypothetical protein
VLYSEVFLLTSVFFSQLILTEHCMGLLGIGFNSAVLSHFRIQAVHNATVVAEIQVVCSENRVIQNARRAHRCNEIGAKGPCGSRAIHDIS